ncbi:MAG TPA: FHA domain-containing protein, partial [Polyangia bacterium]|nr:FHA domain-containing protein [Polyangia bacterium]
MPAPSVGASGRRSSEPGVRWLYPVLDGRLTPIPRGSTILGRDEACAIRLEGNQVSRRHAEIVREGAV